MVSKISPIESPIAGVGARDKSMIPNGTPNLLATSLATNCPTRVILNAVLLIASQSVSKSEPLTSSSALFTTPGPETPTLMQQSPSEMPWNAPAMNGLSSGALQKTTSLAQPIESASFVRYASSLILLPIKLTASILMPVLDEARLTDEHTLSVAARAAGMEFMKRISLAVADF